MIQNWALRRRKGIAFYEKGLASVKFSDLGLFLLAKSE
jgi:hypothetical protein